MTGTSPKTPITPQSRVTRWRGRALLWWARVLQHTVAGESLHTGHVARRNAAMRAAHACGVDYVVIAQSIGLTVPYVKDLVKPDQAAKQSWK